MTVIWPSIPNPRYIFQIVKNLYPPSIFSWILLSFVYRRPRLETTQKCVRRRMCIDMHNMEEAQKTKQNLCFLLRFPICPLSHYSSFILYTLTSCEFLCEPLPTAQRHSSNKVWERHQGIGTEGWILRTVWYMSI